MTIKELEKIKQKHLDEIKFREGVKDIKDIPYRYELMICRSTSCNSYKSEIVEEEFKKLIKENNLENKVRINKTGCFGFCAVGPIVMVFPEGTFYVNLNAEKVSKIVQSHLINDKVVEEYLYQLDGIGVSKKEDIPFYKNQHLLVQSKTELINPECIEDYVALGGYFTLHNVITSMTSDEVISKIKDSGLKGRGGAGFPTGLKWEFTKKNNAPQKYVICNADEGDPGAFMDRTIIESNPHSLLEAMAICGFAVGASVGYVYVRAEYPLAGERLENAIKDANKNGFLGKNIFGTTFNFEVLIKYGAGAFVCGEETALLNSIEGKRGEPHTKPPYPAEKGLFGCPTVINNVETFANITKILSNGVDWFNTVGLGESKGTKIFALSGKINNTGLIELPLGSKIRDVIYGVGGGIPNGKKLKAVQMGGPSGGCIPAELIDTPIDYKNLLSLGSMMGSGGMIVLDEDTCMVNLAKFFIEFCCDESCGKCTPCRIGNKRILEILTKITDGKATMDDLDKLEELCLYVKENSLCGLGMSSPNPVLSTLRYFRNEYEEHIKNHRCSAGVCKALSKYKIEKDKCVGCSACFRVCPVGAISGEIGKFYVIDEDKCINCGACKKACKFGAVKG